MKPQVRIGHFSPNAPKVDVRVDGNTVLEDVGFRTTSDYLEIDAGSHDIAVMPAGGGDAVIEATLEFDEDGAYTVLATNELDSIEAKVMADWMETVESTRTRVRFVHAAPDAPTVDVRTRDGTRLFGSVDFGEASDYADVNAGSYDIEVVPTGTDDVALSLSNIEFQGANAQTIVANGTVADDSLDADLLVDYSMRAAGATR